MIHLMAAHHNEARPLIRRLGLKKDLSSRYFEIYRQGDMALIISGMGKIKSAAAAACLLSPGPLPRNSFLLNIGICGAKNNTYSLGQPVLIHKLLDHDTGRSFYPDILWDHPFPEGSLETFSLPVRKEQGEQVRCDVVDMEGTGAYEAATQFLGPHQVHLVKIVSDYLLDDRPMSREYIEGLVDAQTDLLLSYIASIQEELHHWKDILTSQELHILDFISQSLHLTASQRTDLIKKARHYKLRNQKSLDFLADYPDIHAHSKQERKKALDTLYSLLEE